LVFVLSENLSVSDPVVILLAACQPPGAALAHAFAQRGVRVIAIDGNAEYLTRIAAQDPDWIETLTIEDFQTDMTHRLQDAWGSEPLRMVVNLMPLARPAQITEQMRTLAAILRTTARGLVADQGSIVSLVARPRDPLALLGHGVVAALSAGSAALAGVMAAKSVRVHVVCLPKSAPEVAVETLLHLASPEARQIASTTFDLGHDHG